MTESNGVVTKMKQAIVDAGGDITFEELASRFDSEISEMSDYQIDQIRSRIDLYISQVQSSEEGSQVLT